MCVSAAHNTHDTNRTVFPSTAQPHNITASNCPIFFFLLQHKHPKGHKVPNPRSRLHHDGFMMLVKHETVTKHHLGGNLINSMANCACLAQVNSSLQELLRAGELLFNTQTESKIFLKRTHATVRLERQQHFDNTKIRKENPQEKFKITVSA